MTERSLRLQHFADDRRPPTDRTGAVMTHQVPPAPAGIPAEMTLTLPTDDVATIHGVLAADARAIMRNYPTREQRDYAEFLTRIARAIDHQARQQIHHPTDLSSVLHPEEETP